MDTILNGALDTSNETFVLTCLILASLRIYLEVIRFDFRKLPMTKFLARGNGGEARLGKFHRTGLYFCIGYIVLFAPSLLLA